jgi:hypothetical protein
MLASIPLALVAAYGTTKREKQYAREGAMQKLVAAVCWLLLAQAGARGAEYKEELLAGVVYEFQDHVLCDAIGLNTGPVFALLQALREQKALDEALLAANAGGPQCRVEASVWAQRRQFVSAEDMVRSGIKKRMTVYIVKTVEDEQLQFLVHVLVLGKDS